MTSVPELLQAINTFYAPTTPSELRQHTGKWLEKFQNTRDAWNIAVELVSSSSNDAVEVALFAAQTLKHKIVYDLRQLDDENVSQLRDRLWQLVFGEEARKKNFTRSVVIQLKLALAGLLVQMDEKLWIDPVGNCFELLNQESSGVLEFLALIPEQLANPAISTCMSNNFYYRQRERLLERHVDDLINLVLRAFDSSNRLSLLSCLLCWIQYGGSGSRLIESVEFLDGIFGILVDAMNRSGILVCGGEGGEIDDEEAVQVVDTCGELLNELVYRVSKSIDDLEKGPEWFESINSLWIPRLAQHLASLKEPLKIILSISGSEGAGMSRVLLTLISDAAEMFLRAWLQPDSPASTSLPSIIESILMIAEMKASPQLLEITFAFWSALPSELASGELSIGRDLDSVYEPFLTVFSRLFTGLLYNYLPMRGGGGLDAEERDKFREFRHVVGDCLKDCVRVLGSTEALLLILTVLKDERQQVELIESGLFALRTVSSVVDPRESEALPMISGLFLPLANSGNGNILTAVLLNVGCYSEWLRYHSEHLSVFLQILSQGINSVLNPPSVNRLNSQELATILAASMQSLKYLTESCARMLKGSIGDLVALFTSAYGNELLGRRDRRDLTEALAQVLPFVAGDLHEEWTRSVGLIVQCLWNRIGSNQVPEVIADAIEDYGIFLETMLSLSTGDVVHSTFLFNQVFLESFDSLCQLMLTKQGVVGGAWFSCLRGVLGNVSTGLASKFVDERLGPFITDPTLIGSSVRAGGVLLSTSLMTMNLLLSSQLITEESTTTLTILSQLPMLTLTVKDLAIEEVVGELWMLTRNLITFLDVDISRIIGESGLFRMIQIILQLRPLSSSEIAALTGLLVAVVGKEEGKLDTESINQLRMILLLIFRACLLDWHLSHVSDLALILTRLHKSSNTNLSVLPLSVFRQEILPQVFPDHLTTSVELTKLDGEYGGALVDATINYRPKSLRNFLRTLGETCRRRRS